MMLIFCGEDITNQQIINFENLELQTLMLGTVLGTVYTEIKGGHIFKISK